MLQTPPQPRAAGDGALHHLAAFVAATAGAALTNTLAFGHAMPSNPEDVVIHLGALVCAVMVGWWFANVAAWSATLRRGGTLERFTLPGSKRIAQLLLAAALSTSCIAEGTEDPIMVLVSDAVTPTAATTPPTTTPTTASSDVTSPATTGSDALDNTVTSERFVPDDSVSSPAPPSPPIGSMPVERSAPSGATEPPVESHGAIAIAEHQLAVAAGDNLWSIAADTLAIHGMETPTCGDIAAYWTLVVNANHVRSGNPDLIGVGEVITLPAYEVTPG